MEGYSGAVNTFVFNSPGLALVVSIEVKIGEVSNIWQVNNKILYGHW